MQGYLGDHSNASDNPATEGLPSLYTTVDGSELYQPPFTGYSDEAVPLIENDEDFRQIILRNYVERNGLSYADGQEVLDKFPCSTASVFTHGDIKPKNIIVDYEGKDSKSAGLGNGGVLA